MKLLAAFLFGIIVGIFLWEKWGVGDQYKAYISKLKQKGQNNTQDVVFKPILDTIASKVGKPLSERKRARIERKRKKADERLEL